MLKCLTQKKNKDRSIYELTDKEENVNQGTIVSRHLVVKL